MEQETFDKIHGHAHSNCNLLSEQAHLELGIQNDLDQFFLIMDKWRSEHLDIHHSNLRLDAYLFYRSSKL